MPPDQQPEPTLIPLSAPDWLWEAMETHLEKMEAAEIVWNGIECTFIAIRELPDTEPGRCPEEEEFVWTSDEIAKDRDFEAKGWDHDEEDER